MEVTFPRSWTRNRSSCSYRESATYDDARRVLFSRVISIKAARRVGAENAHRTPEEGVGESKASVWRSHAALRLRESRAR
jgi:hypothetical protein